MGTLATSVLSQLELTRFFCALLVLLIFSHTFGYLFFRLRLPRVIGEITGGLMLGPTVLGVLSPTLYGWLFSAFEAEGKLLSAVSWLGLIMLMFVSGFDIQRSLNRRDRELIIVLSLGSTVIPFVAGWFVPVLYDFSPYLGESRSLLALQIVVGIATAITSIPVISRIFLDLDIMNSHFAKIILATAAFHDIILFIALAVASSLVATGGSSLSDLLYPIMYTLILLGMTIIVLPRVVDSLNHSRWNLLLKSSASGYALIICFLFSVIASLLNVNIIFGALLAGMTVAYMSPTLEKERSHIKEISFGFFIPMYFATVGLKLDLFRSFDVLFFVYFLVFTTSVQMLATIVSARLVRQSWLSSFNLAVAMTARGGPAIVLATVALDIGIISEAFFVTLVLIAIVTSLFAGVWIRYILGRNIQLLEPS